MFLSTVCDVYQPVEQTHELTRRCLELLAEAAKEDPDLSVFVLTKSDLVCRDLDVLQAFPPGSLRVAFSVAMLRDDVAALLEPGAARPSCRLAAAKRLRTAGLQVGMLVNPVLPYVTERELPALLGSAESAGVQFVGFDSLHYLRGHVGGKMERAYERLGPRALARLKQARDDPVYEDEVREQVRQALAGRSLNVESSL